MFSPISIYEEGHRQMVANQPKFYTRFRELLDLGTVLVIGSGDNAKWIILAPTSRLEPNVLFAQDLAVDGEAGRHRVEFEHLDISPGDGDAWGWLFDPKGWPVAEFRPVAYCDDPAWVELWNARSGCVPIKLFDQ